MKPEVAYYRRELSDLRNRSYGLDQILGDSAAMERLKQQIVKIAPLNVPVLITGERGTGKELAAHAIHKLSPRRDETMVMVNAAALPSTLVESELFGCEVGSFTGAERKGRKGKIEQADGGSLFFDEVGDMLPDVQVKLLRVLQDGSFQRVRSVLPHRQCDDPHAVSAQEARGHFAVGGTDTQAVRRAPPPTSQEAVRRILRVPAKPALAGQCASADAHRRTRRDLRRVRGVGPSRLWHHRVGTVTGLARRCAPLSMPFTETASRESMRVSNAVEQVEEQLIRQALTTYHSNKKRVAAELGISLSYIYKRLAQMGLSVEAESQYSWRRRGAAS